MCDAAAISVSNYLHSLGNSGGFSVVKDLQMPVVSSEEDAMHFFFIGIHLIMEIIAMGK